MLAISGWLSGLKGWVLDRTGKLENALIRYRSDAGVITREYPLGAAAVHSPDIPISFRSWGPGSRVSRLAHRTHERYNQLSSPSPIGKTSRSR